MVGGKIFSTIPKVIVDDTSSTGSNYSNIKEYTVSGEGIIMVFCSAYSSTNDYGTYRVLVYHNNELIMGEGTRFATTQDTGFGSSTSVALNVVDGDKIKLNLYNSKADSRRFFRRFLCYGCSVS